MTADVTLMESEGDGKCTSLGIGYFVHAMIPARKQGTG